MRSRTILVADDEPQIRRAVRNALTADDTRVVEAATAAETLDRAASERPDLMVLDLGLPDRSGSDVCRELRTWSDVPILVLSARHADEEKAALLDAGADDYLTKPFSTLELQARVRALMRRSARTSGLQGGSTIRSGALSIDLAARIVRSAGTELHLTPIEWDLLRALASDAGRTLTHQQLFKKVWSGRSHGDAQKYLRVHIANLRRKIERDVLRPRYILTEPGVGYRFVCLPADSA
jgi:two-component system, OmpR family, KDP operon response regulator KdpE